MLFCTSLAPRRGVANKNEKVALEQARRHFCFHLRRERFRQKTPLSGLCGRFSELRSQLTYCQFRHRDYSSSHRLLSQITYRLVTTFCLLSSAVKELLLQLQMRHLYLERASHFGFICNLFDLSLFIPTFIPTSGFYASS